MTQADAIWLATVMDCEGTICLSKAVSSYTRKDGVKTFTTRYSPLLMITNTYLPLLERASGLLGCSEMIQKRKGSHLGKKPCFQLFLRSRAPMLAALREMEPHLMEKRALAQALIQWLEWFEATRSDSAHLSPATKRSMRPEYERQAEVVREQMSRRAA